VGEDQARRPCNLRRCERGPVGERVGGGRGLAGDLKIVDVDAVEANGRVGVQQKADPSMVGSVESPVGAGGKSPLPTPVKLPRRRQRPWPLVAWTIDQALLEPMEEEEIDLARLAGVGRSGERR
jgi:hypothetical protein